MKRHLTTIAALAVTLMGSALVPTVKADEWDKKTNITIDQSIYVEGTVLPAGSYVMKLLVSSPDRHVVQIFNANGDHLIATVLALRAYRTVPTSDSSFKFYEGAEGEAPALHTWFYPGDIFGFEFTSRRGEGTASAASHTNSAPSNASGE